MQRLMWSSSCRRAAGRSARQAAETRVEADTALALLDHPGDRVDLVLDAGNLVSWSLAKVRPRVIPGPPETSSGAPPGGTPSGRERTACLSLATLPTPTCARTFSSILVWHFSRVSPAAAYTVDIIMNLSKRCDPIGAL